MVVQWTFPARRDLTAIRSFIAQDSPQYARKVTTEIVRKSFQLESFPLMGRKVPEEDKDSIREILIYSYRLIYETAPDCILVLAVIHAKRDFSSTFQN
jgi:toxin ParE1/3/4